MGISGLKQRGSFHWGEVPPFWLPEADSKGRVICGVVRELAEELWDWAFRYVEKELCDGAAALEILQEVSIAVSGRLQEDTEVGRNLKGYFRTSFIHNVDHRVLRDSRIEYEGLIHELEQNHHPRAPDWIRAFETRLSLKFLAAYLPPPVRHMFYYRLLAYSWTEIALVFRISNKQARSRFYYGVRKAYEDLLTIQAKRRHSTESEI